MPLVNFNSLAVDSHQQGNPGGVFTLGVILAKSFTGAWPVRADITGGEITVAPRIPATVLIAQYEFPDGKVEISSEKQGEPGFQSYKQMIEFMFASFSKIHQQELAKNLNAGAVYIVEMGDGQFVVIGSSKNPVYTKQSFKTGKKGSDPRGFTMKGDSDGNMWDIMPLSPTVAAALTWGPLPV